MINRDQVLSDLSAALFNANENGLLKELSAYIPLEIIDQFWEAVSDLEEATLPQPDTALEEGTRYERAFGDGSDIG